MKSTKEQNTCVDLAVSGKSFKVEAVAGSGKTFTVRLMAEAIKSFTPSYKCLYLAFNKAAATEASGKMPSNTHCQTTHSLAYRAIFGANRALSTKLSRPRGGYVNVAGTSGEIVRMYKVKAVGIANAPMIAATAKSVVARFEASAADAIDEHHMDYSAVDSLIERSVKMVSEFSPIMFTKAVLKLAKTLWADRIDASSPVLMSHDTYLKMYQLSKPALRFDTIFLDEAQDTSDCVIDIVNRQTKAQIICVGDTYQSIYGWRGAVNALEKIATASTPLSQSFRYGPAVATVATHILAGAMLVKGFDELDSVVGTVDIDKPYVQLFRTNMNLIRKGNQLINEGVDVKLDVDTKGFVKKVRAMLDLKAGKKVKHEDIVIFDSWEELLAEADVAKGELKLLSNLIESGNVYEVIDNLEHHTPSQNPHVILTTAHKSKGMEFPQVILADDFPSVIDEEGKYKALSDPERNLMYVAATRAVECLELNTTVEDIIQFGGLRT